MNPLSQEARRLRNEVYDHEISDDSWANVAEKWCADYEWLVKQKPLRCQYPPTKIKKPQ